MWSSAQTILLTSHLFLKQIRAFSPLLFLFLFCFLLLIGLFQNSSCVCLFLVKFPHAHPKGSFCHTCIFNLVATYSSLGMCSGPNWAVEWLMQYHWFYVYPALCVCLGQVMNLLFANIQHVTCKTVSVRPVCVTKCYTYLLYFSSCVINI